MTKNTFMEAISLLDEDLIEEFFVIQEKLELNANRKKPKSHTYLKFAVLAACFICITFTSVLLILNNTRSAFDIENGILLSYNGDDTYVKIPDSVRVIADYAFKDNENAKNIDGILLGKHVESIEDHAFYGLENLKNVDVSSEHEYFKNESGFVLSSDGSNLIYVNANVGDVAIIPSSVSSINSYAVCYSDIRNITIGENVTKISDYGIVFNDSLKHITLLGVIEIGEHAFYNNVSLEHISAPKVKIVCDGAFAGCTSLLSADFECVEFIGENAFYNCENLEEIEFNELKEISNGAFANCKKLFSAKFENVQTIGNNAFSMSGLNYLYCPNVTSLGRNFLYDTNVSELKIPLVESGLSSDVFNGSKVKVLYGNTGSYIEKYANENGYVFKELGSVDIPDGYVETNDNVYVLDGGAELLDKENGKVSLILSSFAETKIPLLRCAKGNVYSIVSYGSVKYYVKNESITDIRPDISDDISNYGDFEYIEHDTYIEVTHYKGTSLDIVVPKEINKKPVLKLANTFLDGIAADTSMMRKVVKSITAESVTELGEGMGFWRELYSLEKLVLPNVKRIHDMQMQDVGNLKYIDLSSVEYIGEFAFNSMSNCEVLILGEIKEISSGAFVDAKIASVQGKYNLYAENFAKSKNAIYKPED